jgi:alcohol dehydrogenase YqhD (iron-dependent ADH family)
MIHVFERYFTNTTNVETTDRLCEGLLKAMIEEGPKAMKDLGNYEARANIMWAGMIAHNNILGVGRDQDWATHNIEHELSALYDCAHGAGLAVMSPAWMKYVYKHDINRFAQFAVRVWGCDMNFANPEATALEGIARFEQFLKSIGMPTSFKDLGAKEEDIPFMVSQLCKRPSVGSFVKLNANDIESIYKLAL